MWVRNYCKARLPCFLLSASVWRLRRWMMNWGDVIWFLVWKLLGNATPPLFFPPHTHASVVLMDVVHRVLQK